MRVYHQTIKIRQVNTDKHRKILHFLQLLKEMSLPQTSHLTKTYFM